MCISYFCRDSGKNCKAVAFSKDGSLFAWCNGEKWVHFVILVFCLYGINGISYASFTLVCVKVIAVNAGVCMYTLNGVYCFISGFVCWLSEEIFALLLLFIMHPFPCSLGMLSLFGWSSIQYLVSGIDLLVESTENNESIQLVNVTRFLFYRSGAL